MESFVVILAVLFLAMVALGVYAGVKAVGAAKRGVERTVNQARRTVEDTTLRARTYGQPGPAGELAQLRLSLRTSMRATQDALEAGVAEDASLSESLDLFRRLSAHGHELDADLKRLEREPDRAKVASLLPELRERTERVTHSSDALRWAARDRAQRFAADDLDSLSSQIDMEAGALRHWSQEGAAQADASSAQGAGRTASWPGAGAADGAAGGPARSAEGGGGPAEGQPQAITAPDPRLNTYSWQKSPRPETTN